MLSAKPPAQERPPIRRELPGDASPEGRRKRRKMRRKALRRRRRALKKASRRSGPGWKRRTAHQQCVADMLSCDLTVPVKSVRFYDANENVRVALPQRLPLGYKGYFRLGIYSANTLTYVRSRRQGACNNKHARFFGIDPKKDKHWAALLRCITCCGLNERDFRSVMRIRDLKVRGKTRAYKRAISRWIAKLPAQHARRALTEQRSRGWDTRW